MNLNMSFKHMEPTDAIRAYTQQQSERLSKYFQSRINVTWNFSVEKQNHIAHCHLVGNGMDYFAEGSTQDLYASIDVTIDRVEKQLQKHKEIVTDHLHRNGHRTPTSATGS